MKQTYLRVGVIFFLFLYFATKGNAQLTATISSSTNISCNALCNGTATCQVTGGVPPYTYSWLPSGGTSTSQTGLCSGSHTVTVTDGVSASATATVLLTEPTAVNIVVASALNVTCSSSCDGSITVMASGGNAPYSYSWSPAGGPGPAANPLCAGTYTAIVTDANGCTAATSQFISQPTLLVANAGVNQTICIGYPATLIGNPTGGNGPYSYLWSGPSFSANTLSAIVTPTITTVYTLTVTDAGGCMAGDTVTITPTQLINLSFSVYDASCNQSNGAISVLPSGGVAPYTYLWSNSVTNDTNINLSAGVYPVTITDANGCTNTASGGINNSNGPVLSITNSTNPICYQGSNGSVTVNVTGGPQAYTYLWTTVPPQTTSTAANLSAGNYFVTVSDTDNCTSTLQATLFDPPQFYLGAQMISSANCTNNGVARAWATSGNPPYSFSWSNNVIGDTAIGLPPGTITVIAIDNSGCSVSGTLTIDSIHATLVTGKVYSDVNGNCIFDAGDFPIVNQQVLMTPNNQYCYSDSLGDYYFYSTTTGARNVQVYYNYSSPYTTGACPSSNTTGITITTLCDTIANIDFGRTLTPGMQDLRVSVGMSLSPRAGFPNTVNIHYWNVGSVTVPNTTVNLVFDSILSFISSTQLPSINNPAYLEWNTGTLLPGQTGLIQAVLQVPTIQNGGYLGRPLFYSSTINPNTGDQTPNDNGDDEFRIIVGSWDPNDKACYAAGMDSAGNITPGDSLLSYTIRFQNTGNDTAYTIYIDDTLSQYLNPLTLVPGASSHSYTLEMSGNGIMRFNFHTIMLPDSNHNEPLSHGFVKYKVKTNPGLPIGTTIDNTAYIYFDFNPAVVTNTTSNTITAPSSVSGLEISPNEISAYPNPFDESVQLILPASSKGKNCQVLLTDATGRIVLTQNTNGAGSITIGRGTLATGIYFCSVRSEGQTTGNIKLIVSE